MKMALKEKKEKAEELIKAFRKSERWENRYLPRDFTNNKGTYISISDNGITISIVNGSVKMDEEHEKTEIYMSQFFEIEKCCLPCAGKILSLSGYNGRADICL